MEGLLPVLIAVGISIAISLLKKKPVPPTESDSLPQDSPWDDLLKEIQRQQSAPEPQTEYEQYETYETEAESLETIPAESTVVRPSVMPHTETPLWQQREEIAQEAPQHPVFDYEEDAIALSAPEVLLADQVLKEEDMGAAGQQGANADADSERSAEATIFAEGFDPRMAVLYAEVLQPKYREY